MDKKLIGMLVMWYEDVIEYTGRVKNGNLSPNSKV